MIPSVVIRAIEILKTCFGGIDIDILDQDMSRIEIEQSLKLGITILMSIYNYGNNKYRVFLEYQICEDICVYGIER